VVDIETGRPLSDVVVLAVWISIGPGLVHNTLSFHDADEVVTDAGGRFEIPRRWTWRLFMRLDGPNFMFLKPGYGIWRVSHPPVFDVDDAIMKSRMAEEGWRRLEQREGGVVQLVPIRTAEDWCQADRARRFFLDVPPRRIPRWWDASYAEDRRSDLPRPEKCR